MIEGALRGDHASRALFADRYEPVVRAYLAARWRSSPLRFEVDDVVQDVFVEFFRDEGALERAAGAQTVEFRPFLYGVARNVARRAEAKRVQRRDHVGPPPLHEEPAAPDDERYSVVFDRAWAVSIMKQAAQLQTTWAATEGERALKRVELLKLRFSEDLPIREIARRWGEPADHLHHEYATARDEFRKALAEVIREHNPNSSRVEAEAARLLTLLRTP